MNKVLKLEELGVFALAIFALIYLNAEWGWYLALGIGPDISMIGYAAGNKVGAICYNFFHHKAVGALLIIIAWMLSSTLWLLIGIVIIGHSCMDRMMGYGLKYFTGFNFTHLGEIGKK